MSFSPKLTYCIISVVSKQALAIPFDTRNEEKVALSDSLGPETRFRIRPSKKGNNWLIFIRKDLQFHISGDRKIPEARTHQVTNVAPVCAVNKVPGTNFFSIANRKKEYYLSVSESSSRYSTNGYEAVAVQAKKASNRHAYWRVEPYGSDFLKKIFPPDEPDSLSEPDEPSDNGPSSESCASSDDGPLVGDETDGPPRPQRYEGRTNDGNSPNPRGPDYGPSVPKPDWFPDPSESSQNIPHEPETEPGNDSDPNRSDLDDADNPELVDQPSNDPDSGPPDEPAPQPVFAGADGLEYPKIADWLLYCDRHPSRNLMGRNFADLAHKFDKQEYIHIGQLTRKRVTVRDLSEWLEIGKGTADLLINYAEEDVELVDAGRFTMG